MRRFLCDVEPGVVGRFTTSWLRIHTSKRLPATTWLRASWNQDWKNRWVQKQWEDFFVMLSRECSVDLQRIYYGFTSERGFLSLCVEAADTYEWRLLIPSQDQWGCWCPTNEALKCEEVAEVLQVRFLKTEVQILQMRSYKSNCKSYKWGSKKK